jgi:type IV pilus assembly protein PilA
MQLPPARCESRRRSTSQTRAASGFTLIELLVVLAIVAILALYAMPGVSDKLIRERIAESMRLADIVKPKVAQAWADSGKLPVDNAAAGLPDADKIVSEYVSSVAVESGAIQVTFGNRANPAIHGKVLSLRPGVVEDARIVPVSWVCGDADPPNKMTARGLNKTSVPARYLPLNCRGSAPATPAP